MACPAGRARAAPTSQPRLVSERAAAVPPTACRNVRLENCVEVCDGLIVDPFL